jgi:uncharacterized protein (TIGR03435 family)
MIRACALGFIFLSLYNAVGQTPAVPPVFEVSDIRLNKSGEIKNDYFTVRPGGRFVAHNARPVDLFQFAFKVRRDAVSGAPGWFDADRFDITAKAGHQTPDDTLRLMLKAMMIQEFKLKFHMEQKNMGAFVLVIAKGGSKLKNAAGTKQADCKRAGGQGAQFGGSHLECTNMTIGALVDGLPDLAPGYIDRPIVDQTGLTGAYDFRLDWVGKKIADETGGLTMFGAVEKLGLKFEQKTLSLPTIVIDHIEKLAEN